MKVNLYWTQTAEYGEEIELDDDQVNEMKDAGVDLASPREIFDFLNDKDDLIKYEPCSYSRSEFDEELSAVES